MARRKKRVEEHENHERWLVSYADFITLLFAFFVVMYAISSVNEGKYRVLSDTMVEAFSEQLKEIEEMPVPLLTDENQKGELVLRGEDNGLGEAGDTPDENDQQQDVSEKTASSDAESVDNRLWVVASNLDSSLQDFVDKNQVKIQLQGDKIEIQLSSKMLFGSGSARLSANARKAFRDIAIILKPLNNTIHVEGHTDDIPINTLAYPSNWELSAARAASVVEYLTRQGMDPTRLAAIGYGEFRPIIDNDTEEGRRKNRVTMVVRTGDPQAANEALAIDSMLPSDEAGDVPWAESPGGF